MHGNWHKFGIAGGFAILLAAQASGAVDLPVFAQLERGRWQLSNPAEPDEAVDTICLGDPMLLVMLEHPRLSCTQELVGTATNGGSIHYTCPGHGFGRTSIRVETPRLVKVDTQGIANNHPFAYRLQARRIGPC